MDLTDKEKLIVWCCGALREVHRLGLMETKAEFLTPKGVAIFDQLDMTYEPSDSQIEQFIKAKFREHMHHFLFVMLVEFRDRREQMRQWAEENGSVKE